MSETPSSSVRSLTRTPPRCADLSRMQRLPLLGEHLSSPVLRATDRRRPAGAADLTAGTAIAARAGQQVDAAARARLAVRVGVVEDEQVRASPPPAAHHLDAGRRRQRRAHPGLGADAGQQRPVGRVVEAGADVPGGAGADGAGSARPAGSGPSAYAASTSAPSGCSHSVHTSAGASPSSSRDRLARAQREELLDPHAEQVAERARVAAEPDVVVLVDDAAEVG